MLYLIVFRCIACSMMNSQLANKVEEDVALAQDRRKPFYGEDTARGGSKLPVSKYERSPQMRVTIVTST